MQLNPYLTFNGNCEEAFKFYAQALGGKILAMMSYAEMPGEKPAPEMSKRIMHARMTVGDTLLMASDCHSGEDVEMKGVMIALNVPDPKEADRVFQALAKDGKVQMDIQETFWAHRFGMLADRFGTPWMINCEKAPA